MKNRNFIPQSRKGGLRQKKKPTRKQVEKRIEALKAQMPEPEININSVFFNAEYAINFQEGEFLTSFNGYMWKVSKIAKGTVYIIRIVQNLTWVILNPEEVNNTDPNERKPPEWGFAKKIDKIHKRKFSQEDGPNSIGFYRNREDAENYVLEALEDLKIQIGQTLYDAKKHRQRAAKARKRSPIRNKPLVIQAPKA